MAILTDGIDDKGVVDIATSFNFNGTATWAFTFKTASTIADGQIFLVNRASSYTRGIGVSIEAGTIQLFTHAGSATHTDTGITPTANTIYRMVLKVSSGTMYLYVDTLLSLVSRSQSSTQLLTRLNLFHRYNNGVDSAFIAGQMVRVAGYTTALADADITILLDGAQTPNDTTATPSDYWIAVADGTSETAGATIALTGATYDADTLAAAPAGPTLTAPDTVTHGVATTATGNLLSTVNVTTGMTLEYGTVAIAQTAVLDGDDLDFTPDVGVPTAYGTANAVDSLPLTPDSASTGYTPYQVTLDVTDGTASDSRNVTNIAAGSVQTFQVMAAGVNTTVGEGLGGSDLVLIENNHQVTVPLVVDGVTLTIDPDTLDYQLDQTEMAAAGDSITFDAVYYSPTEQQSSKIAVTVTAPAADTPPTSPANQAVNVTEGNTAVGNTSTATGTAPMTYSKGGTDAASFNVNSTTGALTFITAPDYEVKTSHSVTVVANNAFGTDSHIVTVTILNALEIPVMPATATRNVAQPNQLMGVYATSNTPNPAASYTLTGTDAGLLSINGSTGAVTANSPTSVAGKSSYSFNVVATNSEGTDTTAVTVTIVAVVARNMTEWIEANGAGGQTNEAWLKYMLGAGASGKTFNDLMFDWLGILGYTGSLTERVAKWTEANLN